MQGGGGRVLAGLGQRDGYTPGYPRGSHNAGKLLLRLRIKQGLECSQLKAVLEVLQDTSVTCWCPPQSCREGFGEHLEEFEFPEVPRGTSPGGVGCTV